MKSRTIKITVNYDLTNPKFKHTEITPKEKVQDMIRKDMIKHFGWDEGFNGIDIEVIDE